MQFEDTYWHSLDRQAAQAMSLSPAQVGIATNIAKDQVQGLKAAIFSGAQKVELGFSGHGKGFLSQGSTTPEMFGKEEREAMREMAKINKVELSTHATVAASNLSGFTGQQDAFSEDSRESALNEVRRAVDFAADVARGGAVTVHTAEFPREIATFKDEGFEAYEKEKEKGVLYLVDEKTGRIINAIRKDQEIHAPEWETDPETGKPKQDAQGNRLPAWDPEKNEFKLVPRKYEYYVEEAKKRNEEKKEDIAKGNEKIITPEQLMFTDTMKMRADYARAYGADFEHRYEREEKEIKKYRDALKVYEEIEKNTPKDEQWKLKRQFKDESGLLPPEHKLPSEFLKEQIDRCEKGMMHNRDMAISQREQAYELELQMKRAMPIATYAKRNTADSLARLGKYAMERTSDQKLERPLIIAPENIFPEGGYGAHPDELRDLVLDARKKMADQLAKDGMDEKKAADLANKHIAATFDIGHAYTWKKFFKWDPGDTPETHKEKFDKWLFGKVEELQKKNIIGKVHISDNFGYYDEHVTPGQGDVPLEEFAKKLKEKGFKGPIIAEAAGQGEKVMLDAWKTLGSPIYRVDGTSKTWTDVSNSYFGRTSSPSYLVGDIVPNPQEWTLWSGVPLE